MKIKLVISKKISFIITINKRFKPAKTIIPIGCDCHPAYMLNSLSLRKISLPFDWLDTSPLFGIKYAHENISHKFQYFLSGLKKNKEGKVYASNYEYSIFYHYNDLITNDNLQLKLKGRYTRFLELINKKPIYFLNTVTSKSMNSNESVQIYINTIIEFLKILKQNDMLLIYLRDDEYLGDNIQFCDNLIYKVNKLDKKVKIIKYVREKEKFGIWGDKKKYFKLIKELGVILYPKFPKIIILKTYN